MEFVLSNEKLNRNGYRVITAGLDFAGFEKNPVMFFGHNWGLPIGKWENIRVENGVLKATPVFSEDTELGEQVKALVEKGFLNTASIGFRVLESSEDVELMEKGQTRPTVTKAELLEVSIVNIPGNADAHRLNHDKDVMTLFTDGETLDTALPLIGNTENESKMKIDKSILISLGLDENATELQLQAAIDKMKSNELNANKRLDELEKKMEEEQTAQLHKDADTMVAGHINRNALTADRRDFYYEIAKESREKLKMVDEELKKIDGYERPTNQLNLESGTTATKDSETEALAKEFYELSNKAGALQALRMSDEEKYNKLVKANLDAPYTPESK